MCCLFWGVSCQMYKGRVQESARVPRPTKYGIINTESFESLMINMWPVFPVFTSVPGYLHFLQGLYRDKRYSRTLARQSLVNQIFGLLLPSTVKFSLRFCRWIDLFQGRRTSFSPKRSHHVVVSNSSSMATSCNPVLPSAPLGRDLLVRLHASVINHPARHGQHLVLTLLFFVYLTQV